MSNEWCYGYISEADALAGPRIVQVMDSQGRKSHLFYPPYNYPTEMIPMKQLRLAAASLGYSQVVVVPNKQFSMSRATNKQVTFSEVGDPLAEACRSLATKRISLWIEGYPGAKKVFSHSGNTYPRWGDNILLYLLKYGPDWNIFRVENLGSFLSYLEWCLRKSPSRFGRYESYLDCPPDWYRLNYDRIEPVKGTFPDQTWNRYQPNATASATPCIPPHLSPLESENK